MPYGDRAGSSQFGGRIDGTANRRDYQCNLDRRIGSLERPQKNSNWKQRAERMKHADPTHSDHRAGADAPSYSWMGVRAIDRDAHRMRQILGHVTADAPNPAEQIGPRAQKEKKSRY
jgi:hypothetical protein